MDRFKLTAEQVRPDDRNQGEDGAYRQVIEHADVKTEQRKHRDLGGNGDTIANRSCAQSRKADHRENTRRFPLVPGAQTPHLYAPSKM